MTTLYEECKIDKKNEIMPKGIRYRSIKSIDELVPGTKIIHIYGDSFLIITQNNNNHATAVITKNIISINKSLTLYLFKKSIITSYTFQVAIIIIIPPII